MTCLACWCCCCVLSDGGDLTAWAVQPPETGMEAVGTGVHVLPQDPLHGALDRRLCLGFRVAEEHRRRILGVRACPDKAHAEAEACGVQSDGLWRGR